MYCEADEKEVPPAKDNVGAHWHHWVQPPLLHHCVVRCSHCQGREQTAAYHSHCWERLAAICRPSWRQLADSSSSHPGHRLFESFPSGKRPQIQFFLIWSLSIFYWPMEIFLKKIIFGHPCQFNLKRHYLKNVFCSLMTKIQFLYLVNTNRPVSH